MRLAARDWQAITTELHDKGFVIVRDVLHREECDALIAAYGADGIYRKTISMQRYRFGRGESRSLSCTDEAWRQSTPQRQPAQPWYPIP